VSASANPGRLIAVDGVGHPAVAAAAREALAGVPRRQRGGISWWDASGVFEELAIAGPEATTASPRTLLLLYAADLAFRLRWEIRPLLEEGRTVVAAPYVATAMAFGRAVGIEPEWMENLFQFAPPADATMAADAPVAARVGGRGFIEFSCGLLEDGRHRAAKQIAARVERRLRPRRPRRASSMKS
jgi:hypothetical protein